MTTTLTFGQYITYLLSPAKMILMLLMACVSIAAAIGIIVLSVQAMSSKYSPATRPTFVKDETISLTERFFELIFSSTFILLFVSIYFAIDYFGFGTTDKSIWNKYNGLILLLFILGSIVLNSIVDNKLIPLNHIRPGERGAMRLLGMIYMLIIFAYIKFFYVDSNYDSIILYFITLVIGRFVYFDASLESFQEAMIGVRDNLPLLGLALMCTAIMAAFGFNTGYLQEQYGIAFNLFYAHLFLLVMIFIVQRSQIATHLLKRTNHVADRLSEPNRADDGVAYPGQETMWLNAKAINERDRQLRYEKAKAAEQKRRERRRKRLDEAVKQVAANQDGMTPEANQPDASTRVLSTAKGKAHEPVDDTTFDPWAGVDNMSTQDSQSQPVQTPTRYVSHRKHHTHKNQ